MIRKPLTYALFIFTLSMTSTFVSAQLLQPEADSEYADIQSKVVKYHKETTVNEDFTVEYVSEIAVKALTQAAAENMKSRRLSYSTSIETLDIIDAYTLKENGKKVEVPENNYQVNVNKGKDGEGPVFSDRTSMTIVFPDVEKGDTTYLKTRRIETEPMFPGHFSDSQSFWKQSAYEDVKLVFSFPENIQLKKRVVGMDEKTRNKKGRQIITLTYSNPKPLKEEREDFSVWNPDDTDGYAFSTFSTYEDIGKAYAERALPKTVPDQRVKKLAREIVGEETDKKEMARLLYEWVAENITYAGNCIGVGAVVPHDTDFILDNKMGDCKDSATLLEAFLNAVDIDSEQALVNSGTYYSLTEVPLVTSVNHVMTYFPQWDKFVDATSSEVPFDLLAFSVSDKPVVLVENYQAGKRTPSMPLGKNKQFVTAELDIQEDGTLKGKVDVELEGYPAAVARSQWRDVTEKQEQEYLEQFFSSRNKVGIASMTKDDPEPLLSTFNYSLDFERPEFIQPSGAAGLYVMVPVFTLKSIFTYVNYSQKEMGDWLTACGNGYSKETIMYTFPETMKILAKPDDFSVDENNIQFSASYKQDGNTLKVVREINDQTPGNTCDADLMNAQRKTLMKIVENLKAQVVYQH